MDNATTKAVVDSFSAVLNRESAFMRKTETHDQGREMHAATDTVHEPSVALVI